MIPLRAEHNTLLKTHTDLLAYWIFEDAGIRRQQFKQLERQIPDIAPALERSGFTGKENETLTLYPRRCKARVLLLVGIGQREKLSCERFRRAAATAAKAARTLKTQTVSLFEPDPEIIGHAAGDCGRRPWERIGTALGEGALLSSYMFNKYLTSTDTNRRPPRRITVVSTSRIRADEIRSGLKLAQVLSDATWLARDLANAPGSEIYPQSLANAAALAGRKHRFRVRVFDERTIKRMNMGGLVAVAQGSDRPPRFIVLEYNKKPRLRTVVLVGKGVTFDAGGISIKPASGMAEMKMDMSGAAAVIGTFQAAARLKLPVHLVGLIPATENLLGGSAMKPGDILRHHNGKTSEVDNTDAEGRLILADALSYAGRFKPDLVIDLATLTGACVVALGHLATGMMGTDQHAMDQLLQSGERTYERVWQLPLFDEYEKLVKSDVADVKNVGGRWAGAITAAMFLKKFIGDYRWVHLDIAGTAMLEENQDYAPKGASGVGVRLLVDFLKNWSG